MEQFILSHKIPFNKEFTKTELKVMIKAINANEKRECKEYLIDYDSYCCDLIQLEYTDIKDDNGIYSIIGKNTDGTYQLSIKQNIPDGWRKHTTLTEKHYRLDKDEVINKFKVNQYGR